LAPSPSGLRLQIAVVDEGRILELGTHDQLLRREGLYADLYRNQRLTEEIEAM
jgi:ATP-binding cassette subfamily B protein